MGNRVFSRLAASPCCNPELTLDEVMSAYASIGFRKFEAFTSWVRSALDIDADPGFYRDKARQYGLAYASLHLPPVDESDKTSLQRAVDGARFAAAIEAPIVLYKAVSRQTYVKTARAFLDAVEELPVTPVLQNHCGSPISSLDDFREVLAGIADSRLKTLLEAGHFHSAGVDWKQAYELLGDSVRLVHVKDQVGAESVVFGAGEIDVPALFAYMRDVGYGGDFVIELEAGDGRERTLDMLRESAAYLQRTCGEYL